MLSHAQLFQLLRDTSAEPPSTTPSVKASTSQRGPLTRLDELSDASAGDAHAAEPSAHAAAEPGDDQTLDLTAFVFNLWFLQLKGLLSTRRESTEAVARWRVCLRRVYDHPSLVVQKSVKLVLLVHALFACTYGGLLERGSTIMDTALALLLLLESAEVALKLAAYGVRRFWNAGMFDVGRTFEQWENRTALALMGTSLAAWLATRSSAHAHGLGFAPAADMHRLVLLLPTVRLFFVLKQARRVRSARLSNPGRGACAAAGRACGGPRV